MKTYEFYRQLLDAITGEDDPIKILIAVHNSLNTHKLYGTNRMALAGLKAIRSIENEINRQSSNPQ